MKGITPGSGWTKTDTGYVSPCGDYTIAPVGVTTDDGTERPRSKPFFRLVRVSDGTDLGLHRQARIAVVASERDVRRRAARGKSAGYQPPPGS